jgi:ATP-dependent protease ClpP protease subunit
MYSPSLRFSHRIIDKNTNKHNSIYQHSNKNKKMPFPKPPFPNKSNDDDDDDDDEHHPSPFQFPKLFGRDTSNDVYTTKNHIYFKTDVTKETIDKLATEIDNLNNKMNNISKKSSIGTFTPKPIYLHITTNGGDLLAGFFGYDKIKSSRYPINTVIEGCVASAGSLLAMSGQNRYMTPNSHLLIHQLRTGMFGTYEELVDEKNNCHQFMSRLVSMYHENCNGKMTKTKIKEYLKRDIFWNTKTAITNGLVDEEWSGDIEV